MDWHRPVGAAFVVVGAAMFVMMVYGIVNWSPLWALVLFVFLGCVTTGLMLFMRPSKAIGSSVSPSPPEPCPPLEERGGMGFGYCPECGSALNDGDKHCGVCGRRLRWRS